jgi:hypothetical protein
MLRIRFRFSSLGPGATQHRGPIARLRQNFGHDRLFPGASGHYDRSTRESSPTDLSELEPAYVSSSTQRILCKNLAISVLVPYIPLGLIDSYKIQSA